MSFSFNGRNYIENVYTNGSTLVNYSYLADGTKLSTLDYGARHYSATSAHWLSMDPLAEKYYSVSPYAFCNSNPVNFVDPDGRDWYEAEDGSVMWRCEWRTTIIITFI